MASRSVTGPRRLAGLRASTRTVAVIGDPVRHSLSPTIHNAAFAALDLDWVYVALPVPAGRGADGVRALRALGLEGLNVTMPHKEAAAEAVDRLTATAERLGAVNTVFRDGDLLVGDNTDVSGFVDALRLDDGVDPAGRRCVVLGAGGAARAVVLGLAGGGAADIAVVGRTPSNVDRAVALAACARRGSLDDVVAADLIVNATPVGMGTVVADGPVPIDGGPSPVDTGLLRPGQVVVDLVYWPPTTPLLAAARAAGGVAVTGIGMLVRQAGGAFRHWTGEDPPLGAMSAAALGAIAHM